jgi:hypothetical protein
MKAIILASFLLATFSAAHAEDDYTANNFVSGCHAYVQGHSKPQGQQRAYTTSWA